MSQRPAVGCLFEIVETLVLTLIIFVVIQNFVAQPYKVQQQSMERTLEPEQYVLVDKLTPRWAPYARGDIVVFDPPETWSAGNVPFIKRVIGLGGDRVSCCDAAGRVTVNGQALNESSYLFSEPDGAPIQPSTIKFDVVVPADHLFVLGDNRNHSRDSRCHLNDVQGGRVTGQNAFVPEDLVVGRAIAVV